MTESRKQQTEGAAPMNDMDRLEIAVRGFAAARRQLTERVAALEAELADTRARHIQAIKQQAAAVAQLRDGLIVRVENAPGLFAGRRKSVTVDGVRVGFRKLRGTVSFADETRTIERIRALLPEDQAALLIRVRESVHKPAVYDLTAADLKRLGITVDADTDVAFVKNADTDVDKLVEQLLAAYSDD